MFNELVAKLKVFVGERGWLSYHSPRNMATGLSVESSELLEHFLVGANLSQAELENDIWDVVHCILSTMASLHLDPPQSLPNWSATNLPLEFSKKLRAFMDHFSWLKNDQLYRGDLSELSLLLNDILAILMQLSKELGIDPFKASADKLEINRKKYPVELVKDSVESYYIRKKSLQKKQ